MHYDVEVVHHNERWIQRGLDYRCQGTTTKKNSRDLREGQELHYEKASIKKVKNRILNSDDFMVKNEEIEAFLLKENERV